MSDGVTLPNAIRWLETWANAAETPHEQHDAQCVRVVLAEVARLREWFQHAEEARAKLAAENERLRADARAVRAVARWLMESSERRLDTVAYGRGHIAAVDPSAETEPVAPSLPALGRALLDGGHVTLAEDE